MRRNPPPPDRMPAPDGWTSARAEEPAAALSTHLRRRVDLRACGGTLKRVPPSSVPAGGPPRVRRNQCGRNGSEGTGGWTSARAEEPQVQGSPALQPGVDLRACGGTLRATFPGAKVEGGPPRVRRNPTPTQPLRPPVGWTSARAEEPTRQESRTGFRRVDLRACGGTLWQLHTWRLVPGGPPRVRRNPGSGAARSFSAGWTSARAEEPGKLHFTHDIGQVDLRACGGTASTVSAWTFPSGGPPRVRRNPARVALRGLRRRWTSARAEEPRWP